MSYTDSLNIILNLQDNATAGLTSFMSSLDSMRRNAIHTAKSIQQSFKSGFSELVDGNVVSGLKNPLGQIVTEGEYLKEQLIAQSAAAKGSSHFMKELGVSYISGYESSKKLGGAQKILNQTIRESAKATKQAQVNMHKLHESVELQNKSARQLKGNMLGAGLSLLFTGMAIKRFADAAINSITETYKTATGEQSQFNQKVNELSAAFEFFKFSMMDALMSTGLFEIFLNIFIRLINWFARLPEGVRTFIILSLVIFSLVGGLMMVVGQTILFIVGLMALATIAGVSLGAIILLFIKIIAIIFIVIFTIAALYLVWTNPDLSGFDKILAILIILGIAVAIIALLFGGWVVALIAVAIAIVAIIILLRKEIWELIKGLWDGLKDLFIGGLAWLGSWLAQLYLEFVLVFKQIDRAITNIIWTVLEWMASKIDDFINNMISNVNSFLPKSWRINFKSNLSGLISGAKDSLLASKDASIQETKQDIENMKNLRESSVMLMNQGLSKMGDSFKEFASAVKEKYNSSGLNKQTLIPDSEMKDLLGTNGVFGQFATQQGVQVGEQKKTNDLLENILGVNKEQLEKNLNLTVNGKSVSDYESELNELNARFSGSTTN